MTRTNVVLDKELVDECRKLTGIRTQRSVIDHALRELLRHERQKKVLELKGSIGWEGDLPAWRQARAAE